MWPLHGISTPQLPLPSPCPFPRRVAPTSAAFKIAGWWYPLFAQANLLAVLFSRQEADPPIGRGGMAALPPLGRDPNPRSRRWQAPNTTDRWQTRRLLGCCDSKVEDDSRVGFLRAAAALVESWAFLDWAIYIGPSRGEATVAAVCLCSARCWLLCPAYVCSGATCV
jgi:hypothetical protein